MTHPTQSKESKNEREHSKEKTRLLAEGCRRRAALDVVVRLAQLQADGARECVDREVQAFFFFSFACSRNATTKKTTTSRYMAGHWDRGRRAGGGGTGGQGTDGIDRNQASKTFPFRSTSYNITCGTKHRRTITCSGVHKQTQHTQTVLPMQTDSKNQTWGDRTHDPFTLRA